MSTFYWEEVVSHPYKSRRHHYRMEPSRMEKSRKVTGVRRDSPTLDLPRLSKFKSIWLRRRVEVGDVEGGRPTTSRIYTKELLISQSQRRWHLFYVYQRWSTESWLTTSFFLLLSLLSLKDVDWGVPLRPKLRKHEWHRQIPERSGYITRVPIGHLQTTSSPTHMMGTRIRFKSLLRDTFYTLPPYPRPKP